MKKDNQDRLAIALGLSPHQAHMLQANKDKYDLSRLVMRDGALYIPYKTNGVMGNLRRAIFGARVDVIGRDD